jgi:hypothetical protein
MPDPSQRDPAEGSRRMIERELARHTTGISVKNPGREAENPGGTPTDTVRGSAPAHPHEPEGQQGTTMPDRPSGTHFSNP